MRVCVNFGIIFALSLCGPSKKGCADGPPAFFMAPFLAHSDVAPELGGARTAHPSFSTPLPCSRYISPRNCVLISVSSLPSHYVVPEKRGRNGGGHRFFSRTALPAFPDVAPEPGGTRWMHLFPKIFGCVPRILGCGTWQTGAHG